MIKTIDDLRKRYAVRADKEVFELFMDKCEELGVTWDDEEPRVVKCGEAVVFGGFSFNHLTHDCEVRMIAKGYKRLTLSDFKPTRTEYEKVTESIFDLRDEFERGELYHMGYDKNYYLCESVIDLSSAMDIDNCYRKVEKAVDWQDEVASFLGKEAIEGDKMSDTLINKLNVEWDLMSKDDFLGMCRVALRANGEID